MPKIRLFTVLPIFAAQTRFYLIILMKTQPDIRTWILLIVLSGCFSLAFTSCHKSSYERNMAKIRETKEAKAGEVRKQYERALERHQDIQDKETRKRIKSSLKKAEKSNRQKHLKPRGNCPAVK